MGGPLAYMDHSLTDYVNHSVVFNTFLCSTVSKHIFGDLVPIRTVVGLPCSNFTVILIQNHISGK